MATISPIMTKFESYVKVAYSKAHFYILLSYISFESYVKVAYSKACVVFFIEVIKFESYVKVAYSKADLKKEVLEECLRAM